MEPEGWGQMVKAGTLVVLFDENRDMVRGAFPQELEPPRRWAERERENEKCLGFSFSHKCFLLAELVRQSESKRPLEM